MKFETSRKAHEFIDNVYPHVGARNQAVLGRAALFLALGEGIPESFKPYDAKGVTLNDEQILGEELRDIARSVLNHRTGKSLDDTAYKHEFRRYFEYGCLRMKEIWEESGNDQVRFISTLLKLIGDISGIKGTTKKIKKPHILIIENEIRIKILNDVREWSVNGTGTNNGLLIVSGQPGSGKSQLVLDLLAQLAQKGLRFVFFDMKGELEDDSGNKELRNNRNRFIETTGSRYVRLIREGLPINPLFRHPNPTQNAQIASEIASIIRAFAPQLGAKQEMAIREAYMNLNEPDFRLLREELEQQGARGVDLAILSKIVDFNIFAEASEAIPPEEWLDGSIIIDFKEFGTDNDTKALAAALVLNFLIKKMNQQLPVIHDIQPLKMVLFVDEAHLLLPKEHKAGLLSTLARQGRSWGFPVWLASQDADKFITTGAHETNFAELAECGVHFSPQTLTDAQQRIILGGTVRNKLEKSEAVMRIQGRLTTGAARQFWRDGGR